MGQEETDKSTGEDRGGDPVVGLITPIALVVEVDVPVGELRVIRAFARGGSVAGVARDNGLDRSTVYDILRRNLREIFG